MGSLSVFLNQRIDEKLLWYVGPDVTVITSVDDVFVGGIGGVRLRLHPRISVFGESGLSLEVHGFQDSLRMFNTGAGVMVHL